ncbi:DUF2634 domain-containing protein [Candidatus Saccharibacteria bacterium]|nr:DUF2634 domain-containing protein [Candidatus Saccharibacteria bacterium]
MSLPNINQVMADYDDALSPSKTYRLDLENKRITGSIDGVEAIRQHIYKVLSTERASFAIYGTDEGINYGVEKERFIGKDFSFIVSDIERTISDALMQDERILGVNEFVIGEPHGDSLTINCTVATILGDVVISEEARIK